MSATRNFFAVWTLLTVSLVSSCQTVPDTAKTQAAAEAAFSAPKPGQFLGYLKIANATTKTPVSFELLPLNNKGARTVYRAHLKLSTGSHGGHEYASYNFEDTSFDQAGRKFSFQTLNGMTSLAIRFQSPAKANGSIRISTGQEAELQLVHESEVESGNIAGAIWPELAEMTTLTGIYKGECREQGSRQVEDALMEIESVKTRGHSPDDAGELKGYRISARFGQTDRETCKSSTPCFRNFYPEGSFNILSGDLTLKDGRSSLQCTKSGASLACGTCSFRLEEKSAYALLTSGQKERAKPASIVKGKTSKFDSTHGQFYGYVHNSRQNTYQLIAVNVFEQDEPAAATPADQDSTAVNGVVTLYFGAGDTNEYIAYKMKTAGVDRKDQRFFWDSDGEIILKVLTWKSDVMVGEWISKAYGRVGHFMVQKGQMPQMSAAVETLPKISGVYASPDWEFEIAAYSELSESSQEIYPLNSYGWAKEKTEHARRRIIKKLHYDFYSGVIGFDLDDGRTIIGRVDGTNMQMLWWPRANYGAAFSPIKAVTFNKISDNPTPQARMFLEGQGKN
jgi:hypothetical protein